MSQKIAIFISTLISIFVSVLIAFIIPLSVKAEIVPGSEKRFNKTISKRIQLGARPFYLVNNMEPSELKSKLQSCARQPFFRKTDFSIGHRGAPLQFPEHTKESYIAAAQQGAGILECDVTFTNDAELVCRHSQCDLHTTTNILATDLAGKCSVPPDFNSATPFAKVKCCTSNLTLAEFKSLQGKMDVGNSNAATLEEYLNSTPDFRTDLYSGKGTLLSHKESIALFKELNRKMTPELKSGNAADITTIFGSQEAYAQKMIDEYIGAAVPANNVWPQSFNLDDVLYWINTASISEYGKQAVFLDGRYSDPAFDHADPNTWSPTMEELVADGVEIIAPPMWMLVKTEGEKIKPSIYAEKAKEAGLDIITWTLERSGLLKNGGGWYYQTSITNNDGDTMEMLDVLAKDVGIIGIFSDWPATITFYANCMKR